MGKVKKEGRARERRRRRTTMKASLKGEGKECNVCVCVQWQWALSRLYTAGRSFTWLIRAVRSLQQDSLPMTSLSLSLSLFSSSAFLSLFLSVILKWVNPRRVCICSLASSSTELNAHFCLSFPTNPYSDWRLSSSRIDCRRGQQSIVARCVHSSVHSAAVVVMVVDAQSHYISFSLFSSVVTVFFFFFFLRQDDAFQSAEVSGMRR